MATTLSGLRLRLLEPATGAACGGTRVVIHGKGFRPLPHSLLVRFRLAETSTRVEVPARFLLETQLECVVPASFKDDARAVLARRTTLAATSTTVALAPHLVPLHVEVILDSDRVSNALVFTLHQEIAIAKITPQVVLMTPPTTVVVTLNLLKLSASARIVAHKDKHATASQELAEISSLPVFVRVRQVSARTSAVSERTVEARWRISPVGVYEVEFDAVMMTFGDATVEISLNRQDYFRAKDKTPDAVGYCVHRDVTLSSVDPCCLSVTSGRSTEVRLLGEGFVDSGDLTVRLLQRDIQEAASSAAIPSAAQDSTQAKPVAQLSATYVNPSEIRCSVPPNMSFGLTYFQVSLNGGRQYSKHRAIALLHRDRPITDVEPVYASLDGSTSIQIHLARLTVDTVDAPYQIQRLVPPRRPRVKFEALVGGQDGPVPIGHLMKVVNAEIPPCEAQSGSKDESARENIVCCRVPSFLDEVKRMNELAATNGDHAPSEIVLVHRFRISLSLGGESYFGSVPFGCYLPPVIQSMTRHHGPSSGGTRIYLRMKHRVPTELAIQVRFLQLATRKFEIVEGIVGTKYFEQHGEKMPSVHVEGGTSPTRAGQDRHEKPAFLIVCVSPTWKLSTSTPELTKVQVSFDGGFNFVPVEDEQELIAAGLATPRSKGIPSQLVKDMSYLYFLFYPVPRLFSVMPMSADIQGGSFIRIGGDHIVNHGGRIAVVFQSPPLSRKVVGFIENGELRCCVPPFNVGPVSIFVSLNGEQYTKCEFTDPDSKRPIDFVFYSSPLLQRLSPLCTCLSHSSLIRIYGVNLIETGRVKVRFGFTNHSGKLVFKDVAGRAEDGVITANSPLFGPDFGNLKAIVDVALNGNDFSGKILSLYYYASYAIKRVEPSVGAIEIPIPVTLFLSQNIISDELLVRVRFKQSCVQEERVFGPVSVGRWDCNRIEFTLPALSEFIRSLQDLEDAFVDISFDKVYFHQTGNLLKFYQPYKLPPVLSISPLVGHYEQETTVVAKCSHMQDNVSVNISLTLDLLDVKPPTSITVTVVAETNARRCTLTWRCPPLSKLVKLDTSKAFSDEKCMILPARLGIQMSTVHGQLLSLPFHFQYYRMPVLLSVNPRVGYICGGSLISFEFREMIETPTIDIRFGSDVVTSGRVRNDNKRFVECLSPELDKGVHVLAVSFDEQYFENLYFTTQDSDCDNGEVENSGISEAQLVQSARIPEESPSSTLTPSKRSWGKIQCVFQTFAMPQFTTPSNIHRVYGFGPVDGGSYVVIKGVGFIPDGKIYVRFSSTVGDTLVGPSGTQAEVIVNAKVLNDTTVVCTSPPSTQSGRVLLQVTYNLQQYTNSFCFFEYHQPTKFTSRGILCGPVSGGTPVCIQVEDAAGLPEDKSLLRSTCALRFTRVQTSYSVTVDAYFDEEALQLQCIAPAWPSNELVAIEVALSNDAGGTLFSRHFFGTGVRFLFYDPPEGLITIEPKAGPITGGTEVLAFCGKMVDTGEIMVSVTIVDEEEEQLKKLTSVGEDEENEEEREGGNEQALEHPNVDQSNKEVYLVKGKIVGEAVSFVAPAVSKPGIAHLNIALNGINYTSSQTSTLRYKYYCDPIIRRISPTWSAMDTACMMTISGDFIEDHGCKAVVQFQLQQQLKDAPTETICVDGCFAESPVDSKSALFGARSLQCSFQAPQPGFYEIQISLNGGQQFSSCKYMPATFGNYSGSACTALLPYRSFGSPFFLATPTGSVAGGSSVILFMNKKLSKLISREAKCHVQFTPIKNADTATNITLSGSPQKSGTSDSVIVVGEIDHQEGKISCRAPLLRSVCVATLDVLIPASLTLGSDTTVVSVAAKSVPTTAALTSCSAFFGVREREKFHAYESPTITELAPSCGPLSGGTCVVIECSNIVDTGQIFVRFRSTANERECVLVPAAFSRTFPDGSLSASPLLICQTPQVEVIDRIVVSMTDAVSNSTPLSPTRGSGPRDGSLVAMNSKARAQSFQLMAEASLRNGQQKNVLRVTRMVLKNAPSSSISAAVSVLVDFTMNAGEQFIAHSAPFQFYPVIDPRDVKWFPRHLPTQCFDRSAPTETRVVTLQLPKALRSFADSASAAERVSFYFEGAPPQVFSPTQKRRGSSIVLHETGTGRELVVLNAAPQSKLRKESTARRRSSFFRNSSISATSNNLLDSSSASLASNATRPRPGLARGAGPRRPSGVQGVNSSGPSASVTTSTLASTTSPYIAARVVKGGLEVTCPVPEFGGCGAVQVYFSFNAQQFVCLGELYVHEPLTVRENRQHLFTSNIGGDPFTLFCSPSSVFDFLPSSHVLNETEDRERQRVEAGIVRHSEVLTRTGACGDEPIPIASSSPTVLNGDSAWHNRLFHILQVHLVPPNPKLLRKMIFTARSLDSRVELATCSPDELGCCLFETTDWTTDMLLALTPSPGTGLSSFSCVVPAGHASDVSSNEDTATIASSSTTERTHAVVVQLPENAADIFACIYGTSNPKLFIVDCEANLVKESSTHEQSSLLSFSMSPLGPNSSGWYVCVDTGSVGEQGAEVHALVANSSDVQVYLKGSARNVGIWVVAYVYEQPSHVIDVVEIDVQVATVADVTTSAIISQRCSLAMSKASEKRDRASRAPLAKPTNVTTYVHFACADSSRNLSATGVAQLILPDDHSLSSLKDCADPSTKKEVVLRCDMPALPFNGPTILFVQIDGVTFSNSLCVHCYDPRLARISRIDPPCGLLHQNLKVRISGEHFVDNKKTTVRFSDSTRYQTFPAVMERYRLLIVRVAAVRNVRNLLPPQFAPVNTSASSAGGLSPQKAQQLQREDWSLVAPFTVVARVECRDQVFQTASRESAVLTALSSAAESPSLGWEDQFEVQVPDDALSSAHLLVILELLETTGSRSSWELGRAIVPTQGIQEAVLTKRTFLLQEQFRWRNRAAATPSGSDMELFLHLSPLMTRKDVFVCEVTPFAVPQCLRVQISSGDSFFSPCPRLEAGEQVQEGPVGTGDSSKIYRPYFKTYELPIVTTTTPQVLPRTAGGEITIAGGSFIDCGHGDHICVRLFACTSTSANLREQALLELVNSTTHLYPSTVSVGSSTPFFVRDIQATFVSSTSLRVVIPPRLATYSIYYRVSVDGGVHFSLASQLSRIMLYSADSVEPKGGPVSGNTYVSIHGTNLNASMAIGGLAPVVKLTWMRGAKELENITVRGEFYPPEDIVYFYTPQSKFGLQNITVNVELSLVSTSELASPTGAPSGPGSAVVSNIPMMFGQDELPFVVYRTPTIKAVAPLQSLVCGLSPLELIVQGLDEKATTLLKGSIKARFKRRGQMQIADVHVHGGAGGINEGKLVTVIPRFVVGSATATDATAGFVCSSLTRQAQHLNRAPAGPLKVWTRQGAVFVVLLGARNLFVAKKTSTCNPFVVIHCNTTQLKSTRKDGTSSPIWNEIFDFDWRSETELPHVIRLSVENQLSSNQSELLGQILISFSDSQDISKPFCTRAWFPLRRVSARDAPSVDNNGKRVELGDIEVAIAYIPVPPKKAPPRFLQNAALKTSIMSAMQQQKKNAASTAVSQQQETPRARRERLLRAFRRQGAPSSLVPSEIIVELAVNGQDFWSSAPSRCLVVSTPIVLSAEPSFICVSGGTPLTISGMNFVQSGMLRVAFAVAGDANCSTSTSERKAISAVPDSKRIVVVDARYRSSHCITCVTPSLEALGATESSIVNIYVTINGLDFDSVALPLPLAHPIRDDETTGDKQLETVSANSVVRYSREKYVINTKVLSSYHAEATSLPSQTLLHHVRVYLRPMIERVRPADGVYTSSLVVEGRKFSSTGIVVARYCSKNDPHDVRTSHVQVVSPQRMECAMPDFPRGTVVTMSIAVNGVEFVACPGEFEVFQSPRLTQIVPNWVSVATNVKQDVRIRGINLTTKSSASGSVQVSFQRGEIKKVIKGQCVDGEVLCSVPPEVLVQYGASTDEEEAEEQGEDMPPILVNVWLGGSHKTFTDRPVTLHLYRHIPIVRIVGPTNGPIYGGYTITLEGSGFINTGRIITRFQLLQDLLPPQTSSSDPSSSPTATVKSATHQLISSPATFVDAATRFVSGQMLVCTAPSFPQEGLYCVSVGLNGVEFDTDAAIRLSSTWFLVWQNWQRCKQLAAHRYYLEAALNTMRVDPPLVAAADAGIPTLITITTDSPLVLRPPSSPRPTSVETAFGRRAPSRSTPRSSYSGGDNQEPSSVAKSDSPRRRQEQLRLVLDKMVENESLERVEDHFVDLRLLQWHPATTDDRSRSLAALLSELFNAPETQQIMIRRIGFVFRVRGCRDPSTGQYILGSVSSFTNGLKLIFPHIPEKQFEEVWTIVDPAHLGFVSLQSLTRHFVVTETLRAQRPEPGPTHYNPNYALVETKPPSTLILPESTPPTEEAGLPSELFMNYDAFKAVRPRVKGGAFLKREVTASWCNPVPKEKLFQLETDEELERTFMELQQSQQNKSHNRLSSLASSPPRHAAPRPPPSKAVSRANHFVDNEDQRDTFSGVSRGERLARATAMNESDAAKLASPRDASPAGSAVGGTSRFASGRARSILHDDIAPLYLKFLRSKDVQKGRSSSND